MYFLPLDGSIDIDGEHTVLTNNIPQYITWPVSRQELLFHYKFAKEKATARIRSAMHQYVLIMNENRFWLDLCIN